MVNVITELHWARYKELVATISADTPPLPDGLQRPGNIRGPFDYVPPEAFLVRLREWMLERGDSSLYYFLTETVSGEDRELNFEIAVWDLSAEELAGVNNSVESLLVGVDYSWAVFMDHEGVAHVAGPTSLYDRLMTWQDGST